MNETVPPQVGRAVRWPRLAAIATAVTALLMVTSGRYGYHRDELYFLQAGQHLDWGYPDQPPLTPFLARLVSAIAPDSLVALRLLPALAAGAVVVVTALIARELGAEPLAQLVAACCMAVSALLLAVGHLFGTSAFDLLAWTALCWLVLRALQGGDQRLWLVIGLGVGLGLLNKTLVAFLAAGVLIGLVVAGPRDVLRTRWPWLGAVIAVALWAPNVAWQAAHDWPQLELSRSIAAGGSGTSEPPTLFLPFQLVLISPVLVPVWLAGLVRLLRDPVLARVRAFGWAYPILAVVFMVSGGKPYYLGGLYPVLLAAGAPVALGWVRNGREHLRRAVFVAGLALSAAVSIVLMLPVVPVGSLGSTPIVDVNYDAGETVGWPRFAGTVAEVYAALPAADRADTVLLAGNYGEAGALDRFGAALGLPRAYSGHNAYGLWGLPPESTDTAVAVGIDLDQLEELFGDVRAEARIDNGLGLDNDEQDNPVYVCRDRLLAWAWAWPQLTRLG